MSAGKCSTCGLAVATCVVGVRRTGKITMAWYSCAKCAAPFETHGNYVVTQLP